MISIIIPVYNRQEYLKECIRSVQAQTYQNYEIVFVDDGSTDDSAAICKEFAQEHPATQFLQTSHIGVSAARNIALEAAKGDYVFFLDSDDIIHPKLLEVLVGAMKETDADIGGTRCLGIWEQYWKNVYKYIEKTPESNEATYQDFEQTLKIVLGTEGENPLSMIGGVMMRRDVIGETRFRTDLYIGEDFFFIYENMIKNCSTVFLKRPWYYSRFHENNSSWDFGYSGFMNRVLRRELVWKNEEALGRRKYAAVQKNATFGLYRSFVEKKLPKEDRRKIKKVLKEYRKLLFSDLYPRNKIRYVFYIMIPGGYAVLTSTEKLLLRIGRVFRKKK